MEIHEWCLRILGGTSLEEKLLSPSILTDNTSHPAILFDLPSRPPGMEFKRHSRKEKLPPLQELSHPDKRAICLHRFAGHELLAVEFMAYALLAFPEAPKHFRKGLANTLKEEQMHVQLYMKRLQELGVQFGDLPLYKHFWAHIPFIQTPLQYVSVMSLTFEMANLDFAPLYRAAFSKQDDSASALLMNQILEDEINHVSFGIGWLEKMKPADSTSWDAWRSNVPEKLPLHRATGPTFSPENRRRARVPEEWIAKMAEAK